MTMTTCHPQLSERSLVESCGKEPYGRNWEAHLSQFQLSHRQRLMIDDGVYFKNTKRYKGLTQQL